MRIGPEVFNILNIAAENDNLPKGKVGGIGDVVRDVPTALTASFTGRGRVSTVVPSYGFLHQPGSKRKTYTFAFGGSSDRVELYEVPGKKPNPKLTHFVLHHPTFEFLDPVTGAHRIYCDDPPETPFATDATKFARFCAAVAAGLEVGAFGKVSLLHLHDWHAAFLLILRRFDATFERLLSLRTVYTIHNLALQGIRPLRGRATSSLEAWYPQLKLKSHEEVLVTDPEFRDCVNPMAVGIRFADAVHTVSPGYKEELLLPNNPRRGNPDCLSYGGEGLEQDLRNAESHNILFGILNGCEYDDRPMPKRDAAAFLDLLSLLDRTVQRWREDEKVPNPAHDIALKRIADIRRQSSASARPHALLTCVTRLVAQKAHLMQTPPDAPALRRILDGLGDSDLCILQGTGDETLKQFMSALSVDHPNFLFLNGFDNACAAALYANGDLFLMPSSFEPCGISQMLAMRDGQPCVVHHVGGLKDTVQDGITGFSFGGTNHLAQADGFVEAVSHALDLFRADPARYRQICDAAFQKRFLWSDSVKDYVNKLYR